MRKRILIMMALSILTSCGVLSLLWSRVEGASLLVLTVLLLTLIVAAAFWAVTRMLRPLQRITQTLSSVGSLVSMVSQDLTSKSSVLSGSVEETSALMAEMGRGLTQNAERASSLASSVTEASASIEEMGSSIQEVAKNIGHAEVLASETAILAQAGDEAVRSVVDGIQKAAGMVQASAEAVSQLGQKSDEIGRIVSVIDEIADQTNLLALNAAIEAARAGEQGRGFAVVADEVRKLAEKTGQATREIGDLIRNIQKDLAEAVKGMEAGRKGVAEGVDLSEQAQQSLGDIRSAAAKLGELMKEVAKSATEQANAAGEITRVANDMARMTEEFSSSSQAGRESGNQVIRAMDKAATITRESLEQIELLGKSAVELEDQAREIQRLM